MNIRKAVVGAAAALTIGDGIMFAAPAANAATPAETVTPMTVMPAS